MAKTADNSIQEVITRFDKGMTSNLRSQDFSYSSMIEHFDIFSDPNKITPYRGVENGDSSSAVNQIARMAFANAKLYGLSVASGTSQKLFSRNLSDMADATWDTPANVNVSDVPDGLFFVDYAREGKLYWSLLAGNLASYAYAGATYAGSAHGIAATANGLVHSADNIMYVPCGNVIASNNNGSWNDSAFTIAASHTITSLCEWGNYLAMSIKPVNGYGHSKVFMWNRDSSSNLISQVIDWGGESLELIEELDGELIGVSTFINEAFIGKLLVRKWVGGTKLTKIASIYATTTVTQQTLWKQKENGRIYFNFDITVRGAKKIGIWEIGRNDAGALALCLGHLYRADGITTSDVINGYYLIGDYMFVSYIDANNGNAFAMSKTDDQANYGIISAYETLIINLSNTAYSKDVIGTTVMTEPLPVGGQVLGRYKTDAQTSFTTYMTHLLSGALSHSAVGVEASDPPLRIPQHQEITYRLESTGGAEISGFMFKHEFIDKKPY